MPPSESGVSHYKETEPSWESVVTNDYGAVGTTAASVVSDGERALTPTWLIACSLKLYSRPTLLLVVVNERMSALLVPLNTTEYCLSASCINSM